MTSRERVITALRQEESDRVPLDVGGDLGGINTTAYAALLAHCRIQCEERGRDELFSISTPCERLLQHLQIDTRWLALGAGSGSRFVPVRERGSDRYVRWIFTDEWGVERSKPDGGHWYDISRSPLRDASRAELERYLFPDPRDPRRWAGLEEAARCLAEKGTHAVCFGFTGVLFEQCWYLRGMEQFLSESSLGPGGC